MTAKQIEKTEQTPKTLESLHPELVVERQKLADVRAKRHEAERELRAMADEVAARRANATAAAEQLLAADVVDFDSDALDAERERYLRLVQVADLARRAEEIQEGRLRALVESLQRQHREDADGRLREAAAAYVAGLVAMGDALSAIVAIDREAIAAGFTTNAARLPLWLVNLGDAPAFGGGGRLHEEVLEFVRRGWVGEDAIPTEWSERRKAFRAAFAAERARFSNGSREPLPGSREAQEAIFTANREKDNAAAKDRIAAAVRWIGSTVGKN
jgi:hypothetical protein